MLKFKSKEKIVEELNSIIFSNELTKNILDPELVIDCSTEILDYFKSEFSSQLKIDENTDKNKFTLFIPGTGVILFNELSYYGTNFNVFFRDENGVLRQIGRIKSLDMNKEELDDHKLELKKELVQKFLEFQKVYDKLSYFGSKPKIVENFSYHPTKIELEITENLVK